MCRAHVGIGRVHCFATYMYAIYHMYTVVCAAMMYLLHMQALWMVSCQLPSLHMFLCESVDGAAALTYLGPVLGFLATKSRTINNCP